MEILSRGDRQPYRRVFHLKATTQEIELMPSSLRLTHTLDLAIDLAIAVGRFEFKISHRTKIKGASEPR